MACRLLLLFVAASGIARADEDRPWDTMKFYMYIDPALDMSYLRNCPGYAQLINSPHGEGLQEIHVYDRLKAHPNRVSDPQQARVFYLPIMEYSSWKIHVCNGVTHEQRMEVAYDALKRARYWKRYGGNDHFWVSSKSQLFGPDLVGTPLHNLSVAVPMRMRMKPLSKLLRKTIVGRMKPFGKWHPKSAGSSVGKCTFDVGHQPNQEALRAFNPSRPKRRLLYFAGSFDVCCTGHFIRCRLSELLAGTDGDADILLVPSRGGRGEGHQCTERALAKTAKKRGTSVDELAASYARIAAGSTGNRYVTMGRLMAESTFCLAPAGDICTSSRFYSALAAGCIPVVLCDKMKAAFHDFVPYEQFWFKFDTAMFMDSPMSLVRALRALSADEVGRMQRALVAHREAVLMQVGDGRRVVSNLLGEVHICLKSKRPGPTPVEASSHATARADAAGDEDGSDGGEEDTADDGDGDSGSDRARDSAGSAEALRHVGGMLRTLQRQQLVLLKAMGRLTDRVVALERRVG